MGYYDPPEPPDYEIPECCGFEMKSIPVENATAVMCMSCDESIYLPNEIWEPYIPEPDYFPDLPQSAVCPHGESGDCNACNIASDLAYDANRERRFR